MKRLIVKQTSLERKLAAQRYMTNILEVKVAAQTKELEAAEESKAVAEGDLSVTGKDVAAS